MKRDKYGEMERDGVKIEEEEGGQRQMEKYVDGGIIRQQTCRYICIDGATEAWVEVDSENENVR